MRRASARNGAGSLPGSGAAGVKCLIQCGDEVRLLDAPLSPHSESGSCSNFIHQTRESGGVSSREEFSGRIEGDTIVGRMTAGGGSTGTEWQATRIARGSMNTE